MHVCLCVHIYLCTFYMHLFVHVYLYIYVHVYIWMHEYLHSQMCVHMYAPPLACQVMWPPEGGSHAVTEADQQVTGSLTSSTL